MHDHDRPSIVPQRYRHLLHPRHGGTPGPSAEVDTAAVERARQLLRDRQSVLDRVLASPYSEPDLVAAVKAQTPLGSAAVATVVHLGENLPGLADMWVAEHGIVHAAVAAAELGGLEMSHQMLRRGDPARPPWDRQNAYWIDPVIYRVRALLSAVSEDDHRAAEQALAERRGTIGSRLIVTYLMPHREDWVQQSLDEAIDDRFSAHTPRATFLLCSLATIDQFERVLRDDRFAAHDRRGLWDAGAVWTLVDQLGAEAVPLLVKSFDESLYDTGNRAVLDVLAAVDTDQAFQALLTRFKPEYRALIGEAIDRFPPNSITRLAAIAARPSSTAVNAKQFLAEQRLARPDLVAEIVGAQVRVTEAEDASLPSLLVEPPWTRAKRKTVKPKVIAGLTPNVAPTVAWQPGQREEWLNPKNNWRWEHFADRDVEGWAAIATELNSHDSDSRLMLTMLCLGPVELARPFLERWQPTVFWRIGDDELRAMVARFGPEALPQLLGVLRYKSDCVDVLFPILHEDLARVMAKWVATARTLRPIALRWFALHGAPAVALVVPDAVGKAGVTRRNAETALRALHPEIVLAAARSYGGEVTAAVEAILAVDPIDIVPKTVPTPGAWADPALLPQILFADGGLALPAEATKHVLTMYALSTVDQPYAGLDVVGEICDPASLSAFAVETFRRWVFIGMPIDDTWAMTALALHGGDDGARVLTPLIMAWSGTDGYARAVRGVEVLARIGTDMALVHLQGLSRSGQYAKRKKLALRKLNEVAADRGLSADELADRLVPDFGLDEAGTMTLDYGPRQFTVGFDHQLKPFVLAADGKVLKSLPKLLASDDETLAAQARAQHAGLTKDVRTVSGALIKRLRSAMRHQRSWTMETFQQLFVHHPLVWHIARRLVWLGGDTTFRLAEDRTFADVNDDQVTLPPGTTVRVAHPALLEPQWGEVFADYEILQPFHQLDYPVFRYVGDATFSKFVGAHASISKVEALQYQGWDREGARAVLPLPAGGAVFVDFGPGVVQLAGEYVHVIDGISIDGQEFADLDPVTMSELLADLEGLTEK
ncbi:DUF4132 domain-containing protein [Kutzneria sp. 744]|uniref:DUF4132 domain-containing protein n=1 Tax=Kutzneria sp. (strain 744) TaxID=345341 RepID=UPI0005B99EF5|nr:DUF4132 domain-containing protein [Kutzneria sp. 744]